MDCDLWLHPDTVGGILLRQHGDFLPPLFSARQFRKFCLGGWRQLYYLGLFSLGPLDCALVASMVAPRPFCDSAGQESRTLWRRAKKHCVCVSCVCGRNGARGQGCLHKHHNPSFGTAPIYNAPPCQVLRPSWVPLLSAAGAAQRRAWHSRSWDATSSQNLCLLSTSSCVLSVLSHILDLGFFYLVVVLPAGGQREHRGFLFPHVLIKITRECKTVFIYYLT
ncbi:hypothetical protein QBC34DRAFT_15566 [Podospora aff. communis PSN243]|uniref:Uncharacterized protein n=1 Tax=Podospora aff. communis PSN243 TaxID=3040156 RepID=A0AAV9H715_9PEZI|nr:hypothetical protein QBC34DRAFT_15566 [Podospora aff. communis PSN243]